MMKENENLIFLSIQILSIMKSIDTLFLSYNFQCQILKKNKHLFTNQKQY